MSSAKNSNCNKKKNYAKSDDMKVFFHYKNCLIEIKDKHKRWSNGSKQKNRDIWDSEKEKNAKTKNRKQRKQMEKSTNWSRAPTAQPSFSGPACSLSFPAIGNKTKITPRIDTKASVYQFHLNWPILRRQNASKAARMKLVQRSGKGFQTVVDLSLNESMCSF